MRLSLASAVEVVLSSNVFMKIHTTLVCRWGCLRDLGGLQDGFLKDLLVIALLASCYVTSPWSPRLWVKSMVRGPKQTTRTNWNYDRSWEENCKFEFPKSVWKCDLINVFEWESRRYHEERHVIYRLGWSHDQVGRNGGRNAARSVMSLGRPGARRTSQTSKVND